jgi:hypothetical protein
MKSQYRPLKKDSADQGCDTCRDKAFWNFHQHATIIIHYGARAENTALQFENKSVCFPSYPSNDTTIKR